MEEYPSSVYTLDYTYAHSAYSCVAFVFPIHLMFAYFLDIFGILCFITRVFERYKKWHWICGRIYLLSLLWCVGSALLIHNHGTNMIILIAMLCMIIATTIGYSAITLHKYNKPEVDVHKNAYQRFFSWKTLHGVCMAFAWWTSFGRTLTHRPLQWTKCYTQPALKFPNGTIEYVAEEDPDLFFTIGFPFITLLPPLVIFIIIGAVWSIWESKRKFSYIGVEAAENKNDNDNINDGNSSVDN